MRRLRRAPESSFSDSLSLSAPWRSSSLVRGPLSPSPSWPIVPPCRTLATVSLSSSHPLASSLSPPLSLTAILASSSRSGAPVRAARARELSRPKAETDEELREGVIDWRWNFATDWIFFTFQYRYPGPRWRRAARRKRKKKAPRVDILYTQRYSSSNASFHSREVKIAVQPPLRLPSSTINRISELKLRHSLRYARNSVRVTWRRRVDQDYRIGIIENARKFDIMTPTWR